MTVRRTTIGWMVLAVVWAGSPGWSAPANDVTPRRAAIREQAKGLLAVRLKSDVGLSDAQIGEVLPRIEAIEDARRQSARARLRLLGELRRGINSGATDAALQTSLDALDRNEQEQDRKTREELARIDEGLAVPQRVRLRFLLARFRGELARQVETIRENRRGVR